MYCACVVTFVVDQFKYHVKRLELFKIRRLELFKIRRLELFKIRRYIKCPLLLFIN